MTHMKVGNADNADNARAIICPCTLSQAKKNQAMPGFFVWFVINNELLTQSY
jgi:hypothetical protein